MCFAIFLLSCFPASNVGMGLCSAARPFSLDLTQLCCQQASLLFRCRGQARSNCHYPQITVRIYKYIGDFSKTVRKSLAINLDQIYIASLASFIPTASFIHGKVSALACQWLTSVHASEDKGDPSTNHPKSVSVVENGVTRIQFVLTRKTCTVERYRIAPFAD